MDSQNFCEKCGQLLSENAKFCPACGTRVPGRSPEQVEEEKAQVHTFMTSRLKWAVALMLIYSIPFLIIGIWFTVDIDNIVNTLMTDPSLADYIEYYGITYDEAHAYVQYAGIAYLVSSVCGILSSVLCWKRKLYWVALILCIISMFTGVAGLFALFMGLFAFWIILSSKMAFQEYSEQLESELEKIR